jgi:hypothetical protein
MIVAISICEIAYYLAFEVASRFEMLLKPMEDRLTSLEASASSLSQVVKAACPPCLERTIRIDVHWDRDFWEHTLGILPECMRELDNYVRLHNDIHKIANNFENSFYPDISVIIDIWRGGYRQVRVDPLRGSPRSFDCYPGDESDNLLYTIALPDCCKDASSFSTLEPEVKLVMVEDELFPRIVQLYVEHGRFGRTKGGMFDQADRKVAANNTFFNMPLVETDLSKSYTRLVAQEIAPGVHVPLPPWRRAYYNIDISHGLAWEVTIYDHNLYIESKGSKTLAHAILGEADDDSVNAK